MKIQISEHFTYGKLFRFTISPILMMVFTSLYGIVDGFFVSNYVGKTSFAAVNLVMPVLMAIGTVGFMIGTGGSAIVSKTIGEGDRDRANRYFSMLIYAATVISVILSVIGVIFARPISIALGAEGELLENCVVYSRILFAAEVAFVLQNVFQSFLVTAGKPEFSFYISVASGVANMFLDWLFVGVFGWGLAGAAIATVIGQVIGGILPLIYFARKNTSLLRLTKARFDKKVFFRTCGNGSSEMVSNLSMSVVNMLYNMQLLNIVGEDGISAYGVIMYVNFVFAAIFIGYSIGSAPLVGYNYGADNRRELKNLYRKSVNIMLILGVILTIAAELLSGVMVNIFVSYDPALAEMTKHGFMLFSLAFPMMGLNIWTSSFFTALNNGVISALISFVRTLIFQIAAVFILPMLLELDGVWLAVVAAEVLAFIMSWGFLIAKKKKYGY